MPDARPLIDDADRRARLVARHHLSGDAADPEQAASDVVVLHATDPATVFLSVLARCRSADLADVARALYRDRTLVRLMAMRRTMFVVPQALVPVVHHGAALEIAAMIRKRLLTMLARLPTEPAVPTPAEPWLAAVEDATVAALTTLGKATGAQLSAAVPGLRTALLPTTDKAYDVKHNITTQVLTTLGSQGRMVRGEPRGAWTSRHHTWEPAELWWPNGIVELTPGAARIALVQAYLARFGPATEADLAWWTGWSLRQTRAAVADADTTEVGLSEGVGLVRRGDEATASDAGAATAALLPALDPTPMGWKQRDWFLPPAYSTSDRDGLYDRFGNIGPTIWWGGQVVGGWAVRPDGTVATRLLSKQGAEVAAAVADEAERLTGRLAGSAVVPSFPTPLERALRTGI